MVSYLSYGFVAEMWFRINFEKNEVESLYQLEQVQCTPSTEQEETDVESSNSH